MHHQTTEIHMTEGSIAKALFRYTVPVFFSQILQQCYSMADGVIIGQFAGADALAAIGTASLLLSVIINFFIGMSTGISVVTARLFGAEEYPQLKQAITTSVFLCVIAGIVMTAVGLSGTSAFLTWLRTPEEVYGIALRYLSICFWGMTAQLLYNVGTAILRSLGNTRSALIYLGASAFLNLTLDLLLVAGLDMGIAGAAYATLLSQWLSAFLVVRKMLTLDRQYALESKPSLI